MQFNLLTNHVKQMPIVKKINRTDLQELRDHRDNTLGELVKCYTLSQISFMDWIDTRTVKTSWRYLPVRIDTWISLSYFKKWLLKKPYSVMWIRLDEVRDLFKKRNNGKKLTIE